MDFALMIDLVLMIVAVPVIAASLYWFVRHSRPAPWHRAEQTTEEWDNW